MVKNNIESASWVSIKSWLTLFKIFIVLGVTIFSIGQISGVSDTDLAAYIWFLIGVVVTWVLTLKMLSNKQGVETGFLSSLHNISLMLPTLGVMIPLIILIYVLVKTRPILQTDLQNLPQQFFWFNRLSFFLVVLQLFVLNQYYATATSSDTSSRSVWIAAMILFSVLTSASAIELYVVITSFLTDG